METPTTNAPAISPVTANLLAALRSYEMAVDSYYTAVATLRSNNTDWPENGLTAEEQSAFDNARGIIEKQIRDRLILWANTTTPAAQL